MNLTRKALESGNGKPAPEVHVDAPAVEATVERMMQSLGEQSLRFMPVPTSISTQPIADMLRQPLEEMQRQTRALAEYAEQRQDEGMAAIASAVQGAIAALESIANREVQVNVTPSSNVTIAAAPGPRVITLVDPSGKTWSGEMNTAGGTAKTDIEGAD